VQAGVTARVVKGRHPPTCHGCSSSTVTWGYERQRVSEHRRSTMTLLKHPNDAEILAVATAILLMVV
jgi:hypothetical protein